MSEVGKRNRKQRVDGKCKSTKLLFTELPSGADLTKSDTGAPVIELAYHCKVKYVNNEVKLKDFVDALKRLFYWVLQNKVVTRG